jgi:hypothetical protein
MLQEDSKKLSTNSFWDLDEPAQTLKLAGWLAGSDTAIGKLESTKWGLKASRVGQLAKSRGGWSYIYGYALLGALVWAGQHDMAPPAVLALAKTTQGSLPSVALGAMGAMVLARAAVLAYHDRSSYGDARKAGLGPLASAKVYGRHLGKEAASRLPNPQAFAHVGWAILSLLFKGLGMQGVSASLLASSSSSLDKARAFKQWKADAAQEALLMANPQNRSLEAYRECARFLLASRMGHFGLAVDAPEWDAEGARLRDALAPGFERMAPTRTSYGLLAESDKPASREPSGQTKHENLEKKFEAAANKRADPMFAPEKGLPALCELMRLCMREHDSFEPRIRIEEIAHLQRAYEPWRSALEARDLASAIGLGDESGTLEKRAGGKRI